MNQMRPHSLTAGVRYQLQCRTDQPQIIEIHHATGAIDHILLPSDAFQSFHVTPMEHDVTIHAQHLEIRKSRPDLWSHHTASRILRKSRFAAPLRHGGCIYSFERPAKGAPRASLADNRGMDLGSESLATLLSSPMILDAIPDLPHKDAPAPNFDGAIAVVLHLHYPELWDEVSTFLTHSKLTFRLIVTLTAPNPALEEQINFQFPGAKILNVENLGRDIRPFVSVFQSGLLDGISLICKIHGKRSVLSGVTGARFGHLWRRRVLLDLLGSPVQVQNILNHFAMRPNLGMMGPATLRLKNGSGIDPGHEASLPIRGDLCVRAGLVPAQIKDDFFAGTMFWARTEALSPLKTLRLGAEMFTDESTQIGDQFEHGFERFFADCTRAKGFQLADIEPLVLVDPVFPIRSKGGQILAPRALFEAPRDWYRHRWIEPLPDELKGRKVALVSTPGYVAKDGWLTCLCLASSDPVESPTEALFQRDPGGFDIALWADIFQSAPQLWDSDEVLLVSDGQARALTRAALEDPELRSFFEEVLVWHKEGEAAYRYEARLKRWLV